MARQRRLFLPEFAVWRDVALQASGQPLVIDIVYGEMAAILAGTSGIVMQGVTPVVC